MEIIDNNNTQQPTQGDSNGSTMSRVMQVVKDIFTGNIWTRDAFRRQWKLIALILFFMVVYINSGYRCEQQLKDIATLQKQLVDLRYEYLTLSAELVDKSRQSNLSGRLRESGSQLTESQTPAIKIE